MSEVPYCAQNKARPVTPTGSKSVLFAEPGVNRENLDEDSIDACRTFFFMFVFNSDFPTVARQAPTDNVSIQTSFLVPNASPQSRTAVPSAADVGSILMVH